MSILVVEQYIGHFVSVLVFTFTFKGRIIRLSLIWVFFWSVETCTVFLAVGGEGGMPRRLRTAYTNTQVMHTVSWTHPDPTTFTWSVQLLELEKEFHFNKYLCRSVTPLTVVAALYCCTDCCRPRRIEIAAALDLTERQVKARPGTDSDLCSDTPAPPRHI